MLKLVVSHVDGNRPSAEYQFDQDAITFGRSPKNDLAIDDKEQALSGQHGRIERAGSRWVVIDQSTNGTWLNGDELPKGSPVALNDADEIVAGDFRIRVSFADAGQTIVRTDPRRAADRLSADLAAVFASHVKSPAAERRRAIESAIHASVGELSPAQQRAILASVADRFSDVRDAGAASASASPRADEEELYLAGYKILQDLAGRFLEGRKLQSAKDAARFGRLLQQTLEVTFDWIAKCLEGRKKFEDEYSANVTMMFALEGNPLKRGRNADQIGEYLLDWGDQHKIGAVRESLESAFRDLTLHQLGLLAGAQEAVTAVLRKLDPATIEKTAKEGKGLKALVPGMSEWEVYREIFTDIMSEENRLYEQLISPSIRRGYVATHEEHQEDGGES